jgi:hypothetical protein
MTMLRRRFPPPSLAMAALAAITFAGCLLRIFRLGEKSLWFDEASTYHLVQGSLLEILGRNAIENSAPPLFPLLLGLLTGPGAGEAWLRAPAMLAGVAAIPLGFALARQFVAPGFALLVPLLIAVSPTQVEFSQQVREYSMAFCVAAALLASAVRFLDQPGPARAALFSLVAATGLCTQYGIAILLAGINLVCVVALWGHPERRRAYALWLLAQLPAAATGLVLLVTTIRTQLAAVTMGNAGYLMDRYWDGTLPGMLTLLASPRADIVHFAFPGKLMLAMVIAGVLAGLGRAPWRRAIALLVAPVALTVAAAMAGAYPFGGIRQDMFLLPMLYVVAALGLCAAAGLVATRIGARAAGAAALLFVAMLTATGATRSVAVLQSEGPEALRPILADIAERLRPGQRIYVYWGAQPAFRYYWRTRPEPWLAGSVHWSGLDQATADQQMTGVSRELADLAVGREPYWLVISHILSHDLEKLLRGLEVHSDVQLVLQSSGSYALLVRGREAAAPRKPDA